MVPLAARPSGRRRSTRTRWRRWPTALALASARARPRLGPAVAGAAEPANCQTVEMGSRPLRHYYNDSGIELSVDPAFGTVVEPWTRHRARFEGVLASLTDEQWAAQSRCDAWTNLDVISHLVDVDAFWAVSFEAGRGGTPTTYLKDFDPAATPSLLVDSRAALSTAEILDAFLPTPRSCARPSRVRGLRLVGDVRVTDRACVGRSCSPTRCGTRGPRTRHPPGSGSAGTPNSTAGRGHVVSLLFGARKAVSSMIRSRGPRRDRTIDAHLQLDDSRTCRCAGGRHRRACRPGRRGDAGGIGRTVVESLTGRLPTFPPDGVVLEAGLAAQLGRARRNIL